MKKAYVVAASVVTSAMIIGGLVGTAFAWHPVGKINKSVQNVTNGSNLEDANDDADAVSAKPGDIVKYVVKVWNEGKPSQDGHNDMVDVEVTDALPDGVELVSDPAKRDINEHVDVLRPGESKTFEYEVKVTKADNGLVDNEACFTGDSEVQDARQDGCDNAKIKVEIPKEEPKPQILAASTLPQTGAGGALGVFAGVSGLGYAVHRFVNRKR